ncbi:MAG: VWA domain-containing protein [Bacteroidaceae bacterium]|nr:VWA domain-containing protein [Bacteroidaceae bacterium]
MKAKQFKLMAFCLMSALSIGFISCGGDDDDHAVSTSYNVPAGTVQRLAQEVIGNWDEGYVTEDGVFLYKKNESTSATRRLAAAEPAKNTELLYFSNKDQSIQASLLINKEDNRPVQFVMKDGTLKFSFLSDEVLELVFQQGSDLQYVDQISYDKAALDAALQQADYKTGLQRSLFYLVKVCDLNKLASYPTVVAALKYFSKAFDLDYSYSETISPADAGLSTNADGTVIVAVSGEQFESEVVEKVYSTITVWTGKASFKVGGSSCTLSGTVFCSDPMFAEVGEFGIVCDENPDNLYLGRAEFEGKGALKDGNNFDVDIRGLKSLTTYYYRAYYKFNNETGNGDLILDPAQQVNNTTLYDGITKEFTTDENRLTVDVVMLMDISASMSDEISMVKNSATSFYNLFKERCDAANIHLLGLNAQVITFSDINVDGAEGLTASGIYNLQNDEEKAAFENFVNDISLSYGGDPPESALEALGTAFSRSDWGVDDGFHRQVFILWTDASYKVVNSDIWAGNASKEGYRAFAYDEVQGLWNAMPTGRRLILFAPYGQYDGTIDGDWRNFDAWKNVLHVENTYENLSNISISLDYIISELTGKESEESHIPAKYAAAYRSGKPVVRTGSNNR